MKFVIFFYLLVALVSCSKGRLNVDNLNGEDGPKESTPSEESSGPGVDLTVSGFLAVAANPYYSLLGAPDDGYGSSNDLWASDGTDEGTFIAYEYPDGAKIKTCFPDGGDTNVFDGGIKIVLVHVDADGDDKWGQVDVIRFGEGHEASLIKSITHPDPEGSLSCRYVAQLDGKKFFSISKTGYSEFSSSTDLWVTDGSSEGTKQVSPGANNGGLGNLRLDPVAIPGVNDVRVVMWDTSSSVYKLYKTTGDGFTEVEDDNSIFPITFFLRSNKSSDGGLLIYSLYGNDSSSIMKINADGSMVKYESEEEIEVFEGPDAARVRAIIESDRWIYIISNHGENKDAYIDKATGQYSNSSIAKADYTYLGAHGDYVYFSKFKGATNQWEIWRSNDMKELSLVKEVATTADLSHAGVWNHTILKNRFVSKVQSGQTLFVYDMQTDNSTNIDISSCSSFELVQDFAATYKNVKDVGVFNYICRGPEEIAFLQVEQSDLSHKEVFRESITAHASSDVEMMKFFNRIISHYLNAFAFYHVDESTVIGASPF